MKRIDLHCDTLTMLKGEETLANSPGMVSLERLIRSDTLVQCCAAFIPTGLYTEENRLEAIEQRYQEIKNRFHHTITSYSNEVRMIGSYEDVKACENDKKVGLLFTIEDGGVLTDRIDAVERFYQDGVRLVSFTWNHENYLGYPNSQDPVLMEKGLKPYGIQVLEEMERLGMIIDVSHLSDGGFWDVVKHSKKPFVASHSNARAVTNHPRNLTDEMIRALAERGGVTGLNFCPPFLAENSEVSRVEDMVRHVQHIYQVGGAEVLALGSDFDGIEGELEVGRPEECEKIADALQKAGIPNSVIEAMWFKNSMRVLKENL